MELGIFAVLLLGQAMEHCIKNAHRPERWYVGIFVVIYLFYPLRRSFIDSRASGR